MFLHVSVILFTLGVLSQHALQVISQHALQQGGRGVLSQHALQVVSQDALQWGGACSRGVPALGGCLLWGRSGLGGGGGGDPTKSRQLLLWTVRILLECILVAKCGWENRLASVKHCLIVCDQKSIVNSTCRLLDSRISDHY